MLEGCQNHVVSHELQASKLQCFNRRSGKKTLWIYAVLAVNGISVAGILIVTVYILLRALKERSFMQNSSFRKTHLKQSLNSSKYHFKRLNFLSLTLRLFLIFYNFAREVSAGVQI